MTRFLIDAHLPRRLVGVFRAVNVDAVHTSDLPDGNRSTDHAINEVSVREERVVVTKDADFVVSFLLQDRPFKLLLVSTGNIHNRELMVLFERWLPELLDLFETASFVEMTRAYLITHNPTGEA